jgi:hypothetical protein
MALLIYSPKCKYSSEILEFVDKTPSLKNLVTYHDISARGIPPNYRDKITRVPTMITKNGKFLVGSEVKQWLASIVPDTWESAGFGGGVGLSSIADSSGGGDFFELDSYGQSLQPALTPELEAKINRDVKDAHAERH